MANNAYIHSMIPLFETSLPDILMFLNNEAPIPSCSNHKLSALVDRY